MSRVIRTVHPVGQGGFYTEEFYDGNKNHTVVYDCGGSNKELIEKYLEEFLATPDGKKKEIDAVFISHLHADHVNGLEFLLNNADVKLLVLPQLSEEMKWEAWMYNWGRPQTDNGTTNPLIHVLFDTGEGFYNRTRILQVSSSERSDNLIDLREINGIHPNISVIGSGTRFGYGNQWLFIPYNPPTPTDEARSFVEYLRDELGEYPRFEDLPRLVKGDVIRFRELYASYFKKSHNAYSMTLFSGVYDPKSFNYSMDLERPYAFHPYFEFWYDRHYSDSPNCLYMGDFETASGFDKLKGFYSDRNLWKTIRSIQVPHHGSRYNYHRDLYEYCYWGFISAGEHNRFHHPHLDVLIDLAQDGCFPIVVTERKTTRCQFYINWK